MGNCNATSANRYLDCSISDERECVQTIDVTEEIEEDVEFFKDLLIICGSFTGARSDRNKKCRWMEDTWRTPQITKFLPKGYFIVIFSTEEEQQKILEGGLWIMDSKPLHIQRWHRNFNPLKTDPYDKPVWIPLNNLLMEYYTEDALEKIGRSLGTLMDIDTYIAQGDSYIYARLQLVAVKRILACIKHRAH
ncbi:hypothetical protein SUGI_0759420 [Cryptomeria japonica]|nr:hypothetical protein SUGI_0759420 [Cryptomeria japonica]